MKEVLIGIAAAYLVGSLFYLGDLPEETPKAFVPGLYIIMMAVILFIIFIAGSLAWKLLQLIGQITLEAFV